MGTGTMDRTEGATAWAAQPGALRRLAPVFLAGGLAGLASGAWIRIVMRLSALAAPETVHGFQTEAGARIGEITLGGTLFLVVFVGIGSAILGTAFYLATRAWLPTRRQVRAVAFGILELLVFGSLVIDSGNRDFTIVRHGVFNVVLFAGAFLLHGILLVLLQRPCRGLIDIVGGGSRWRERLIDVAASLGLVLVLAGCLAIGTQLGGLGQTVIVTMLVASAAGLAFIAPGAEGVRRALFVLGGFALGLLTLGGALELLDAATTIV